MNISSKSAEIRSIVGLVLSILFFVGCWILGHVLFILPIKYLAWQQLGGSIIWAYLVVLFHHRSLAEQEKRDMDLLVSQQGGTIFQGSEERAALFTTAQNRLAFFEKWFTKIFAISFAVYSITLGVIFVKNAYVVTEVAERLRSPLLAACSMAVIAFLNFIIARYSTGMATEIKWKAMRSGGSYMLSTAMLGLALAAATALRFWQIQLVINIMAWVVPIIMIVIGTEAALNIVLDLYRPRIEGEYHRPPFDSRILGVFNEPGGVLHTAAATIDYQFGFKVSQTWFYKLLGKAIIPLVLLAFIVVYLLSCFVVVDAGQEGVIEHFGSFENGGRVIKPGLSCKLPWPFEKAYIVNTDRIQQIAIGYQESEAEKDVATNKPLIWGVKHYEFEYQLLVATDTGSLSEQEGEKVPPVSIVIAAVPVQYRVKNVIDYLYNHQDSRQMLEAISYRELVKYAASAELETEAFGETQKSEESLLGAGRKLAADTLEKRIQHKADELGLGIEIVMVGLQGVHPPIEVTPEYHAVISSVQTRQRIILDAIAERNRVLTQLGGNLKDVNELYDLAVKYQQRDEASSQALALTLDKAFSSASGDIYKEFSQAKSYAYERAVLSEATGKRFASQIKAFKAAPEFYLKNQRLAMLEEALAPIRKYIIVSDEQDSETIVLDLKEQLAPSFDDIEVPVEN